jgi:hypothetical protein
MMRGLATIPTRPAAATLRSVPMRPPAPVGGRRGLFAQARRGAAERPNLPTDAVEQIAQRVVELLRLERERIQPNQASQPEWIDAEELARRFGLTRTWVYENAGRLGGIKVSDGPRSRLRFDPQVATQALRHRTEPVPAIEPPRPTATRRRRTPPDGPLLPIYDPRSRGAFARWHPANRRRH